MQLFTRIAIVCDHTMVEPATALRAVLESFRLRVDFYRMVQRPQVLSFFAHPPAQYAYTIVWTHGSGSTTEDMHLAFEVVDQKEGNYQQPEGGRPLPSNSRQVLLQSMCGNKAAP